MSAEIKEIRLEVARESFHRCVDMFNILNAKMDMYERDADIIYSIVAKVAKERVDKGQLIKYPENWKEAVKEQLVNVWMKDPKLKKWLRFVPKKALRKFIGKGVKYTTVHITADVFYPHISIREDSTYVHVHKLVDTALARWEEWERAEEDHYGRKRPLKGRIYP